MQRYVFLGLVFLALFRAGPAQSGEINVLTDLLTPFPPGCVAFSLPEEPVSADNTLVDEFIDVPSINSTSLDAEVRVTIWRVGCADDGYSVVMLRLQQVFGDNDVLIPQVFADAGILDYPDEIPFHQAQLIQLPAVGQVGATGDIISRDGTTFMLGVDNLATDGATDFFPEDYNDAFTLELWWGDFSPTQAAEAFFVDEYLPALDPPQFDEPVLHGRFNGQWVASGVPRTGLGLHIAETLNDENFVFVVFYTYLDGQPFWVTGNTLAGTLEPGRVEMDVFSTEGGEFFTLPGQPSSDGIAEFAVGSLEIQPLDCNRIRIHYDFGESGLGTGSMNFERFIRTAGYDCNPWE